MPNWTSNRIYVEGDAADIRAFLEAVKWQDELFDFNRIIPRPPLLDRTGSGMRQIDGKEVEAWYIVKRDNEDFPGQREKVRLFTPEEEAELAAIGHRDWYDWSVTNWGTKWNACRVQIDDSTAEEGHIEILFDTAWCAPVPVLRKMVDMFPKLRFDCRWRHEDEDPYPNSLNDEPDSAEVAAVLAEAGAA
jgi:hypothetical protein